MVAEEGLEDGGHPTLTLLSRTLGGRESYSVPGPAAFEHQSHEWHTRKCSTCNGSGRVNYVRQRLPCQKCGTTGGIRLVTDGRLDYVTCPQCKGTDVGRAVGGNTRSLTATGGTG